MRSVHTLRYSAATREIDAAGSSCSALPRASSSSSSLHSALRAATNWSWASIAASGDPVLRRADVEQREGARWRRARPGRQSILEVGNDERGELVGTRGAEAIEPPHEQVERLALGGQQPRR